MHASCHSLRLTHSHSHSDAPAISAEETTTIEESSLWDEDALLAKTVAPVVVVKEREILDVKTLSQNMSEQSDTIQQKINLEETKAALQAAREGMEREAQRLKQKNKKKLLLHDFVLRLHRWTTQVVVPSG